MSRNKGKKYKHIKFTANYNLDKLFHKEGEKRLKVIGRMMKKYFNEVLQGLRTGRFYPLPGTGKLYQASAPGEYPAKRLGDLRKSLTWCVDHEPDSVCLTIGSPLHYATSLELERDRPFLRRGLMENFDEIKDKLRGL